MLEKRLVLAVSLMLGFGLAGCSDDDGGSDDAQCVKDADCTDAAKPVCSDGVCIAGATEDKCKDVKCDEGQVCNAGTGKCEEAAADKCKDVKCDEGKTCYSVTGTCLTAEELCKTDDAKEWYGDACIARCAEDEYRGAGGKCEKKAVKPDTCGNKQLDEGEFCDRDANGNAIFADGKGTCDGYGAEQDLKGPWTGTPGCADTCMGYDKGTCRSESDMCGNGKLDEGEACDYDKDGKLLLSEETQEQTCASLFPSTPYGTPKCGDSCRALTQHGCSATQEEIDTCKVVITDNADGTKTVTATAGDLKEFKGAIICATPNNQTEALVPQHTDKMTDAKDGTLSLTFDQKGYTEAGSYGCGVYLGLKDVNRGVFCADGDKAVAISKMTIADVSRWTFTVENTSEAMAIWSNFDVKNNLEALKGEGIAPNFGVATALKLKVDLKSDQIQLKPTVDSSSSSLNALQIVVDGKAGNLGASQKADESTHVSIGDLSGYDVLKMTMSAKYGKNNSKMYVTSVTDAAETVVKTLTLTDAYQEYTIEGNLDGAKAINIYGDNESVSAQAFEKISLWGTAK